MLRRVKSITIVFEVQPYAAAGDTESATALVFGDTYEQTVTEISAATDTCISDIQTRMARKQNKLQIIMLVSMAAFILSFVLMVRKVIFVMKFSREGLLVPIVKVSEQMTELAQGRFENKMDLKADESEVGTMVGAILFMNDNFTKMISEISSVLGSMAQGRYNVQPKEEYVGEFLAIKNSMNQIIESTKKSLNIISDAAKEIDAGSEQLAQAAGETTKLLEDTIAAVEKEITIADEAAANMSEVMVGAKDATSKMSQMAEALQMEAESIRKIDENISMVQIMDQFELH